MKKLLCLSVVALFCLFLAACFDETQTNQEGDVLMRIAIYPSVENETYLFEIRQDGTMQCQVGIRRNNDVDSSRFFKSIVEQKEVKLADEDLQKIIALANELKDSSPLPEVQLILDSWSIALSYEGTVYEADYWTNPSESFRELIEEVIRLSAIDVNLHAWA